MRRFQPTSSKGIRLRVGPGKTQGPRCPPRGSCPPAPTFLSSVIVTLCFESRGCSWVTTTGACAPCSARGRLTCEQLPSNIPVPTRCGLRPCVATGLLQS